MRSGSVKVPTWDRVWSRAPRTLLDASGLAVGLPDGQMGNSEVGHLNLGAGRVVMQDLVRIGPRYPRWLVLRYWGLPRRVRHVRRTAVRCTSWDCLGDGGVHAVDRHLFALFDLVERERVPRAALPRSA
jgi:2,3-bisphosphoglycerate-independent phosphoglycerate mutase